MKRLDGKVAVVTSGGELGRATSMNHRRLLEVVATTMVDVRAALAGGADRLELAGCHTPHGALTPSAGLMAVARRAAPELPLYAMIRPRYGSFTYQDDEVAQMEHDLAIADRTGMNGVLFGAVTAEGELDVPVLEKLFTASGRLRICLNMAFDRCRDQEAALAWLIRSGRVERVLTAGGARTVLDGAERIASLIGQAEGRIGVMPGAVIDAHTLQELLRRVPAIDQVHVSVCVRLNSEMFSPVDAQAVAAIRGLLAGGKPA